MGVGKGRKIFVGRLLLLDTQTDIDMMLMPYNTNSLLLTCHLQAFAVCVNGWLDMAGRLKMTDG